MPTALFAVDDSSGKHLRMGLTITPLSGKLALPLNKKFGEGNEAGLAAAITKLTGTTLVCWEHSAIPDIVAYLGTVHRGRRRLARRPLRRGVGVHPRWQRLGVQPGATVAAARRHVLAHLLIRAAFTRP